MLRKEEIIARIKNGAVFIYPTDTIYGIGCSAQNGRSVQKIRRIKQRPDSPFSIWAPSKGWINKHCSLTSKAKGWIEKLPGHYTLIMSLKDKNAVVTEVNPGAKTIGIRMPDHWFHVIVEKAAIPIVTTSANVSGQPFMTSLEDLQEEVKFQVDFIIYEGPKQGRPSKIIKIEEEKMVER